MSKTKNIDVTETEKEVTENVVEQPELEETTSEVVESSPEIEQPEKVTLEQNSAATSISVKANKAGKMGVYKFLMLYPQDKYVETLLKYYYPKSFFTKEEWFKKIDEINKKPINN